MTGAVDANSSRSFLIKFLKNKSLKVNINWEGERIVKVAGESKRLETLAEEVYERVSELYGTTSDSIFNDLFSRKAREISREHTQRYRLQYYRQRKDVLKNRLAAFCCFNRVIELYEDSERSRSFIGRIVYRIIRIFKDRKLHAILEKSRRNLDASRKFTESFKNWILPYKYPGAKYTQDFQPEGERIFIIPKEDFWPIAFHQFLRLESSTFDLEDVDNLSNKVEALSRANSRLEVRARMLEVDQSLEEMKMEVDLIERLYVLGRELQQLRVSHFRALNTISSLAAQVAIPQEESDHDF